MDIARRDRALPDCFAIAGQRAGVFQPLQFLPPPNLGGYLRLRFRVGKPLRFVFATRRSSFRLIDLYMLLDAPRSDDFDRFPRLAERAAPAAICCFFDFAGITKIFRSPHAKWIYEVVADLRHRKYAGTPVNTISIPIPEVVGATKTRSTVSNAASNIETIGTIG